MPFLLRSSFESIDYYVLLLVDYAENVAKISKNFSIVQCDLR